MPLTVRFLFFFPSVFVFVFLVAMRGKNGDRLDVLLKNQQS